MKTIKKYWLAIIGVIAAIAGTIATIITALIWGTGMY
jgi:hypothetical protein